MIGIILFSFRCVPEYVEAHPTALFYAVSFTTFVTTAYVPAYLGDRSIYAKERANGLYGPMPFLLANFFIGLPWVFPIFAVFFVADYRPVGAHPYVSALYTYLCGSFSTYGCRTLRHLPGVNISGLHCCCCPDHACNGTLGERWYLPGASRSSSSVQDMLDAASKEFDAEWLR